MKRIAIIEGNTIVNIADFDADYVLQDGEVDVTEIPAGIGWEVDAGGNPIPPPVEVSPTPTIMLSKALIVSRMTYNEFHLWKRAAGRADATNTPAVADKKAQQSWYWFETADDPLDTSAAEVVAMRDAWIGVGITLARADIILAPVIN